MKTFEVAEWDGDKKEDKVLKQLKVSYLKQLSACKINQRALQFSLREFQSLFITCYGNYTKFFKSKA